jgi:ribose transport system substrate-binding protein
MTEGGQMLRGWRRYLAVLGLAAAGAALAAGVGQAGSTRTTVKCGDLPYKAPVDKSGLLKTLPASVQAGYNNYYNPVLKSAWTTWKPKHKPPYTIGYSDSFSGNFWRADALARLKTDIGIYQKAGLVKKLIYTNSNLKNDVQIQQMRSMIQQHVDIILSIPNSPTAFNGVIKEAYDAGIPVLTLLAPVTSPYAINVDDSNFLLGARQAQGLVQLLHGKGSVVTVDGLPGTPGSIYIHNGGYAIFQNCPNIKILGNFAGNWNNADGKSGMLKFLATHPQKVDGVWEQGSMALGIMQALQQAGRPLVPVTDGNPDKASLAVWRDNMKKGYHGVATANVPSSGMDAMFRIGMRMLDGQGIKINAIVKNPPLVMDKQLNGWVKPDWTESTPGVADAPPGTWLNEKLLDSFFMHPRQLKTKTIGSCPCKTAE